jgi:methylated-DNA-[protein]-cysteine S-methyltransferase
MARTPNIYYSDMETPIGHMTLASTKKGLCWMDFNYGDTVLRALERWSRRYFLTDQMQRDDLALREVKDQLEQYFNTEQSNFTCELDLMGTSFQKLVWNSLLEIPYGEVRTYKEVAQAIGAPKAVRAVGGANNKNSIPIIIPCHRVIGSNGALVGYGGGLHIKEQLLQLEGYIKPKEEKKKA